MSTMDPQELEEVFQEYMADLSQHVPDGIYDVDLTLLYELDLLTAQEEGAEDDLLSYSFYVIESADKLTLYNQKFVIWILPKMVDGVATTYTLIAINEGDRPQLEMVFTTSGVYNHSNLVLRILEKFLAEIEENEQALYKLKE